MRSNRWLRDAGEFLVRDAVISKDADLASDFHCFFGNGARWQIGIVHQRPSRRKRIRTAATDGCNSLVWFDNITCSADQKRLTRIGDDEQSLQIAQNLVSSPVLGELYGCASEVPVILLQLGLEAAE